MPYGYPHWYMQTPNPWHGYNSTGFGGQAWGLPQHAIQPPSAAPNADASTPTTAKNSKQKQLQERNWAAHKRRRLSHRWVVTSHPPKLYRPKTNKKESDKDVLIAEFDDFDMEGIACELAAAIELALAVPSNNALCMPSAADTPCEPVK
jgi:hypothetical protein